MSYNITLIQNINMFSLLSHEPCKTTSIQQLLRTSLDYWIWNNDASFIMSHLTKTNSYSLIANNKMSCVERVSFLSYPIYHSTQTRSVWPTFLSHFSAGMLSPNFAAKQRTLEISFAHPLELRGCAQHIQSSQNDFLFHATATDRWTGQPLDWWSKCFGFQLPNAFWMYRPRGFFCWKEMLKSVISLVKLLVACQANHFSFCWLQISDANPRWKIKALRLCNGCLGASAGEFRILACVCRYLCVLLMWR